MVKILIIDGKCRILVLEFLEFWFIFFGIYKWEKEGFKSRFLEVKYLILEIIFWMLDN